MKIYLVILSIFFLTACNSSTAKKEDIQTSIQAKEETSSSPKTNSTTSFQQNGDYTALFLRDETDCEILSIQEMASVLELEETEINLNNEVKGYCRFQLQLRDGTKTTLAIHPLSYDKKTIQREIESFQEIESDFGKNNRQGFVLMSDTNDIYFCIRSSRGELFMFNPAYDGAIEIKF